MDERLSTLTGMRILIVEDEFLLADDLVRHFEGVGSVVLGPAADVAGARRFVTEADAAILDINLKGGTVFPLADELFLQGVPFVFFSGADGSSVPERFRFVGTLPKPVGWQHVAAMLAAGLAEGKVACPDPQSVNRDDMVTVLPKLRLSARLMLTDASAADRLVEKTLERAVAEFQRRPPGLPTATWLTSLLESTLESRGRNLMN
jgi:CheY-like chemotaxis protein